MNSTWHIITGEYPPQPGGVSDYTAQVARGLAQTGREVHVWTGGNTAEPAIENGVHVHRCAGTFGPLSLRGLSKSLSRFPRPRRLFIQYVPPSYGWKAMNVPFAIWVWSRRRLHGDSVRTLFHEVWFPWVRRPWKHNVIAAVQRVMAFFAARGSQFCYVSTTAWNPRIKSVCARASLIWLPIPTGITVETDSAAVAAFRATLPSGPVVAHFGTYGQYIGDMLMEILPALLRQSPDLTILLLGRNGETCRQSLVQQQPEWERRIVATGNLPPERVAVALRACDLAMQPYPDGASTRRTSLMAVLALGVPVVTTVGALSEPLWADCGLPITPADRSGEFVRLVKELIDDPERRTRVGAIAGKLYADRFTLRQTLQSLLDDE